jgi:hypothetical protein
LARWRLRAGADGPTSGRNKPALLIGGGSPVATYLAVAEFGHRLGIGSMLLGDLDPVSVPALTLQGHDVVIEPSLRHRGWHFLNSLPTDSASWGSDEFCAVIRQLRKLRFNHVTIAIETGQPFAHIEYAGIAQSTIHLIGQTPFARIIHGLIPTRRASFEVARFLGRR